MGKRLGVGLVSCSGRLLYDWQCLGLRVNIGMHVFYNKKYVKFPCQKEKNMLL